MNQTKKTELEFDNSSEQQNDNAPARRGLRRRFLRAAVLVRGKSVRNSPLRAAERVFYW